MENKLSKLYLELGEKLVSMIPTEWNEIHYLGEVEKDKASWSSIFYFKDSNKSDFVRSHDIPKKYKVSEEIYAQLLKEVDEVMFKIYDCFAENEQELWDQISMSIDNSGKFNINYFYNNIKTGTSQLSREVVWAYETFGFMPCKGSYSRNVLDKYLKSKT